MLQLFQRDFYRRMRDGVRYDYNLRCVKNSACKFTANAPSQTLGVLTSRIPIIFWLPRYRPAWLLKDILAGLTVAVLLVPQSLAYAKLAHVPAQYGLTSSWLPGVLYAIMGTSKGLLTGEIISEIIKEPKYISTAPEHIATAVTFMIGILGLITGFSRAGFILDWISTPVLTGFISATAISIVLGQIPSLIGTSRRGLSTVSVIQDIVTQFPQVNWMTAVIGISTIFIIESLQFAGRRWGAKSKIVRALCLSRAAIVLILFTGLSYGLNKDRDAPLFAIIGMKQVVIEHPKLPSTTLLGRVVMKSIAPFLVAAVEHVAFGKIFAAKNKYALDTSQEMMYLGVVNLGNSFFTSVPVGGAISRTVVNDSAGVMSPLSGIATSAAVIVGIYKLSGTLYWVPSTTLAGIIITAVYNLFGPFNLFIKYWRTNFWDFLSCMLCFWTTLASSSEVGMSVGVASSILYTLIKTTFAGYDVTSTYARSGSIVQPPVPEEIVVPAKTTIVKFEELIHFPNAFRNKERIMDYVQAHYSGAVDHEEDKSKRSWSVAHERLIKELRARDKIDEDDLTELDVINLDMTHVSRLDVTAINALVALKKELDQFCGKPVDFRLVSVNETTHGALTRNRDLILLEEDSCQKGQVAQAANEVRVHLDLASALAHELRGGSSSEKGFDHVA